MTVIARYKDAPRVEEQSVVTLVDWLIFEIPGGSRHFCGFHAGKQPGKGRVSSGIVRFDPDTLTGTTESGRVYQLQGPPGDEDDTGVVRDAWLVANGLNPSMAEPVEAGMSELKLS